MTDHVTPAPGRLWTRVTQGVALALLIGATWSCANRDPDPGSAGPYVTVACRDWVRARLTAPATAEFTDETTAQTSPGQWTVTGAVDAQNPLGALTRSTWTCEATHTGKTTTLVSIHID